MGQRHPQAPRLTPDQINPDERRHLLRLWLTAHAFASVENTLRGGIPARQDR